MEGLQEVLLVQLATIYGTSDYSRIATALQQHPLLTSQTGPKIDWTPELCRGNYDRVCDRLSTEEGIAEDRHSASFATQVWRSLHANYMARLKQTLRDDEEQYETLRLLTEKTSDAKSETPTLTEIPSSTQDTLEDDSVPKVKKSTRGRKAHSKKLQEEEPLSETSKDEVSAAMQDVEMTDALEAENEVTDSNNHALTTPQHGDAIAAELDETTTAEHRASSAHERSPEVDEVSVASKNSDEKRESESEELAESALQSFGDDDDETSHVSASEVQDGRRNMGRAKMSDDILENTEDEIAVAFSSSSSKTPSTTHDVEMVVPRVTRTRSSTLNTVASTDTNLAEESVGTKPVKRKAGRPSKKHLIREESSVKTPDEISFADDPNIAAATKKFQSTIGPVLSSITSHRYSSIFANPVSDREAPNYSKVIKYPMDFKTIRAQIKTGEIGNVTSFQRSILQMLSNAVVYNSEESEIALMARDLLDHVEEAITLYKAAEDMAEVTDDRTPKRRRRNDA